MKGLQTAGTEKTKVKKLAAYYLLLLYAASVCKPLSVWFADVLAHSYAAHQHLGVVHHEEGTDHVHHQMGKAAKDDAPEQKSTAPKTVDESTSVAFVDGLTAIDPSFALRQYPAFVSSACTVFLAVAPPPPWA